MQAGVYLFIKDVAVLYCVKIKKRRSVYVNLMTNGVTVGREIGRVKEN